ncbi:Uncharacterized protein conserved in archaea (DUF531) [Methanosarcina sp. WWM596]|nr:Uncharacterized protein conserved in archaea (DUF531) [Methanosarcina sp. WWM596]
MKLTLISPELKTQGFYASSYKAAKQGGKCLDPDRSPA